MSAPNLKGEVDRAIQELIRLKDRDRQQHFLHPDRLLSPPVNPVPEPEHQPAPGKEQNHMYPVRDPRPVGFCRGEALELGNVGVVVCAGTEIIVGIEPESMVHDIACTNQNGDDRQDRHHFVDSFLSVSSHDLMISGLPWNTLAERRDREDHS